MSIQVTTFVLCHIILPNLFVVTCMSHCGEYQLGGKFYAEIWCLKHCLIVFQNIHFCFVCYRTLLYFARGICESGAEGYAGVSYMYLLHCLIMIQHVQYFKLSTSVSSLQCTVVKACQVVAKC